MSNLLLQLAGAFLEQIFIVVLLTALLNQRSRIGTAAMTMCFCARKFRLLSFFGFYTDGVDI